MSSFQTASVDSSEISRQTWDSRDPFAKADAERRLWLDREIAREKEARARFVLACADCCAQFRAPTTTIPRCDACSVEHQKKRDAEYRASRRKGAKQ